MSIFDIFSGNQREKQRQKDYRNMPGLKKLEAEVRRERLAKEVTLRRESAREIERKERLQKSVGERLKHQKAIEKLRRKTEKAHAERRLAEERLARRQARGAYFAPLPMFKAPKVSSVKKVAKKAGSTKRRIGIF